MGDREFPFLDNAKCDSCGAIGAFDIYGDYLCSLCLSSQEGGCSDCGGCSCPE